MINYNNYDAILFDMDGTIFDSEIVHREAWKITANQFGQVFTDEMYLEFIGMTTPNCMLTAEKLFNNTVDMPLFSESYHQNLERLNQQGLPLKKGFLDYLAKMKQLNKPLGIVTSSAYSGVNANFIHHDFYSAFSVIITRDDVTDFKPHPAPYLLACDKLKVKPESTLVFEDSSTGATSAVEAGCHVIGIPDLVAFKTDIASRLHHEVKSFENLL